MRKHIRTRTLAMLGRLPRASRFFRNDQITYKCAQGSLTNGQNSFKISEGSFRNSQRRYVCSDPSETLPPPPSLPSSTSTTTPPQLHRLTIENPHPRDAYIHFDPVPHTYTIFPSCSKRTRSRKHTYTHGRLSSPYGEVPSDAHSETTRYARFETDSPSHIEIEGERDSEGNTCTPALSRAHSHTLAHAPNNSKFLILFIPLTSLTSLILLIPLLALISLVFLIILKP